MAAKRTEAATARTNVGFIGVGTMGAPMSRNLARAGFAVHVHDLDAAAARRMADELDGIAADSPAAVAKSCEVAITMLPRGSDVRAVALGPNGLASAKARGRVLLDMSSSEPAGTVALAKELAGRGIAMVDAPVSGGRSRAIDGTLTLMVGGDDAAVERCLPALRAMGKSIVRTGAVGSGHATKALNNLIAAAGSLIAAEALLIGSRFGLDPKVVLEVVNTSTGMNYATRNLIPTQVLTRAFKSGFAHDLMVKDLDIAIGLARGTKTPATFAETCRELWAASQAGLGPGRDHSEIVRWLESRAGSEIGRPA
jgi:3-hydroxyisobutyrate dehydrogenase